MSHARISRTARAGVRFGGLVVGFVVGSVAFVTALAYWVERVGVVGLAVVGFLGFVGFVTAFPLPDSTWKRLTTGPEERARANAIAALTYCAARCRGCATTLLTERTELILATTTVEDFDRFLSVFSTKGAEKRAARVQGATVFRDPK
jgi:hypothetical protein